MPLPRALSRGSVERGMGRAHEHGRWSFWGLKQPNPLVCCGVKTFRLKGPADFHSLPGRFRPGLVVTSTGTGRSAGQLLLLSAPAGMPSSSIASQVLKSTPACLSVSCLLLATGPHSVPHLSSVVLQSASPSQLAQRPGGCPICPPPSVPSSRPLFILPLGHLYLHVDYSTNSFADG